MPVTATDDFDKLGLGLDAPAVRVDTITPSDTDELAKVTRGFLCTVAGDLAIVSAGGDAAVIPVLAGVVYPIRLRQVKATGTTTAVVVGLR